MNKISFNGFSEKELNLFFTLIFLANEKKNSKIVIPFSKLKSLSNAEVHSDRFIKSLENINLKLIKLAHKIEIDNKIHIFSLFNIFTIDKNTNELKVQINEPFTYMLNDLIGNFTQYELESFVKLKSIYSKNMFKLIKQWDVLKSKTFELEELRKFLNVPKAYNSSKMNDKVLKPILTELPALFSKFELEKLKTGRKVTHYKFSWKNKKKNFNDIVETVVIEISDKLSKSIEKARRNIYLNNILTDENIEKLLEEFDEKSLIKGLNHAYKEVKSEIKSITYVIKTIESANIEKTNAKKFKITEENQNESTDKVDNDNASKAFINSYLEENSNQNIKLEENENIFQEDLFKNMDLIQKEKIEEEALSLCSKETDIDKAFLKTMKKKSETIYWNTMKPYVKRILKK